jgi:hypothetical protein
MRDCQGGQLLLKACSFEREVRSAKRFKWHVRLRPLSIELTCPGFGTASNLRECLDHAAIW